MDINITKASKINALAESVYVGSITAIYRYAGHLVGLGSGLSMLIMPASLLTSSALYWAQSVSPNNTQSKEEIGFNDLHNGFKVATSGIGVAFVIAGMATLGFGVMIASGYLNVARSIGEAGRSARRGRGQEALEHLKNGVVSGLISGGFTLMTFFPGLGVFGGFMVFAATAYSAAMAASDLSLDIQPEPVQIIQPRVENKSLSTSLYRPSISTVGKKENNHSDIQIMRRLSI